MGTAKNAFLYILNGPATQQGGEPWKENFGFAGPRQKMFLNLEWEGEHRVDRRGSGQGRKTRQKKKEGKSISAGDYGGAKKFKEKFLKELFGQDRKRCSKSLSGTTWPMTQRGFNCSILRSQGAKKRENGRGKDNSRGKENHTSSRR